MDSGAFLGVKHSVSGKLWRARLEDERAALTLAQQLEISEILARVLAARGISAEDADSFLHPTLRDILPNPSILRDMDKAANRLAAAIASGETIAVFGDYDVDGATSGALILRFLNAIGSNGTYYIPDRLREGYGPNTRALKSLAEQGVGLVITVDCGISAFAPLDAAAAAGRSAAPPSRRRPARPRRRSDRRPTRRRRCTRTSTRRRTPLPPWPRPLRCSARTPRSP